MNYAIHDFMTQGLGLKDVKLLLYALVYNFSQDGNGCFYGSNDYAAKKVNAARETVNRNLAALVEEGYLSRSEGYHNGRQTVDYVALRVEEGCDKLSQCDEKSQLVCENVTQDCDEKSHNNKVDSLNDNQKNTPTSRAQEKKLQIAEFVSMTADEHQKLVDEFGETDTASLIQILDNYKGSSGKKYKSDYRAIRSWCVERLEEQKRRVNQARFGLNGSYSSAGPRVNERGETPTVASMRAAAESFERIAQRHAEIPAEEPIDEQNFIDD